MDYNTFSITDIGSKRAVNQDAYTVQAAKTDIGCVYMCVVCDGVGGLNKGEVASASVVSAFSEWFKNELPEAISKHLDLIDYVRASWDALVSDINTALRRYKENSKICVGTTVSALFVACGKALLFHIGDSRIYQLRQNKICYRTKDQTLAQKEYELGNITQEQLLTDKRSHVLLQCVGASVKLVPERSIVDCFENDTFVICTDGFYRHLSEKDIAMLSKPDANEKTLQMLVNLVKSRNEADNITAVFMK